MIRYPGAALVSGCARGGSRGAWRRRGDRGTPPRGRLRPGPPRRPPPGGAPRERAPLEPAEVRVASDAAGTFLGMKDELLLERIGSAEVVQAKINKGGSSISFRLDFSNGARAAFKPEQINPQTVPRKEIAAYRLNRLLGMNAVPPATARTFHRSDLVGKLPPDMAFHTVRIDAETLFDREGFVRGEVSYWIPIIVDSRLDLPESVVAWWRWMSVGEEIPADKLGLMAQLSSLLWFDLLTNNSD